MAKRSNILVGVCGGIAAYKTCQLVSLLVRGGYSVKVVMTRAAINFVTPLTFQTLSQNPVYCDIFDSSRQPGLSHVALCDWADLCVIAPLSANTLAKLASGLCDNLLTTVVCALPNKTKVILAPAMNVNMWQNPLIQANVKKLKKIKNYTLLLPAEGRLACGVVGPGRMPDPKTIFAAIKK